MEKNFDGNKIHAINEMSETEANYQVGEQQAQVSIVPIQQTPMFLCGNHVVSYEGLNRINYIWSLINAILFFPQICLWLPTLFLTTRMKQMPLNNMQSYKTFVILCNALDFYEKRNYRAL